jgi:hypothetical protein
MRSIQKKVPVLLSICLMRSNCRDGHRRG